MLFLWLALASTVASAQPLWNYEEVYKAGPFVKPKPMLVEERVNYSGQNFSFASISSGRSSLLNCAPAILYTLYVDKKR